MAQKKTNDHSGFDAPADFRLVPKGLTPKKNKHGKIKLVKGTETKKKR